MQLDFNLTDEHFPKNIRILPDGVDPNKLHQVVIQLPDISNPSIAFAAKAKAGDCDDMSDEEFNAMLHAIKEVSKLWQDPRTQKKMPSASVFDLLIRLFEHYLHRAMSEYINSNLHHFD